MIADILPSRFRNLTFANAIFLLLLRENLSRKEKSISTLALSSRQRFQKSMSHQAPDRVLLDLEGTSFSPGHNIQADVPAENVLIMYQATRELDVNN